MTALVAPPAADSALCGLAAGRPVRSPLWIVVVAAVQLGCGTRAFLRPAGPGAPAPDAAEVWMAASAACGAVRSYVGTLGLTGRVGDQRIRGLASATIDVAIDPAARLAIEARVSRQLAFRLGGTADRAVLWLRDGNRVVVGRAADLVAALVGAGFPPSRLREILGGCPSGGPPSAASRVGGDTIATVGDATVQLRAEGRGWRVTSWWFGDWDVVYGSVTPEGPKQVTVSSAAGVKPVVQLSFGVVHAEHNVDVPATAFEVSIPAGAREMTLDELRSSGPLGETEDAARNQPDSKMTKQPNPSR